MRRWLGAARTAAAAVADRPELWLPGALAWSVVVGWIALLASVLEPPGIAELTFFGAGFISSGLWPWNLVATLVAAAILVAAGVALASSAEVALLLGRPAAGAVARASGLAAACALPAAVMLVAIGILLPPVAQDEFNAPDAAGGPLLRTIVRMAPLLGGLLVALAAGAAVHAAAVRAVLNGAGVGASLRRAPGSLARLRAAGILHAAALAVVRIGFVLVAVMLLRVLWSPIGLRLAQEGFGLAAVLLLVGFVAIWLCLVLAGGALHAWGSVTWTRLLAAGDGGAVAHPRQMERRPGS